MANITVIIGPPCAGKSTYIQSKAATGDVLIDYDAIAKAIGNKSSHNATGSIRDIALSMRWRAIYSITEGIEDDAWIIHTAPNESLIKEYAEAGAVFQILDPGIEACIERAKQDERPEETIEVIQQWYEGKERLLSWIDAHVSIKMISTLRGIIDSL